MVDLLQIAEHEVAHAVMRWLRGMPATEITANHQGGVCAGTGKVVRAEDELLVTLAGFAWESGCGVAEVDLANSRADDFDVARRILQHSEWLRLLPGADDQGGVVARLKTVDDALLHHFRRAGDLLNPYAELVHAMGERLAVDGVVSARSVVAMCREFAKRSAPEK